MSLFTKEYFEFHYLSSKLEVRNYFNYTSRGLAQDDTSRTFSSSIKCINCEYFILFIIKHTVCNLLYSALFYRLVNGCILLTKKQKKFVKYWFYNKFILYSSNFGRSFGESTIFAPYFYFWVSSVIPNTLSTVSWRGGFELPVFGQTERFHRSNPKIAHFTSTYIRDYN